ncbi:hypothetical protein A9Q99_14780 [Gammaproteobacteria bacterium 45_16_T64]|nr:hypothetical protein A9Q99_14780 [Gammaproteobacteria bacterium 45_16_T64]
MQNDDKLYQLIARCAIRDQHALEQLYQTIAPYLNHVAFGIVKSEDLSNDVVQEAFIQIWENAASYRVDKSKPITWLTSIVRYRALDRLAKEKRYSDPINNDSDEDNVLDNVASTDRPDKTMMRSQDMDILGKCMDTLNERTKHSIELAYLQGYSRDEIASRFNTSANTVKSWLRRGASRLKQCLEHNVEVTS